MARRQRFGRGRRGTVWSSPPGGLWLSALVPAESLPRPTSALSALALGLALVEALETWGLEPRLKWPNDLVLGRGKLAGIITHRQLRAGAVQGLRIGLGLNVHNRVPSGASSLATALRQQRRPCPPLAAVAALALQAIETALASQTVADQWLARCEGKLWRPLQPLLGPDGDLVRVAGLAADGRLRLQRLRSGGELLVDGSGWRLPFDGTVAVRGRGVVMQHQPASGVNSPVCKAQDALRPGCNIGFMGDHHHSHALAMQGGEEVQDLVGGD